MTELVSAAAKAQAVAQHADDPFLLLLTIDHADIADGPLYLANNREPVVSRGNTYVAFPLSVGLPTDSDQAPEARVTASNFDRRLGRALESITTPAECTIELVLASTPDTVERSWGGLSFTAAAITAETVSVGLSHINYWDQAWPRKRITPKGFPGLFA